MKLLKNGLPLLMMIYIIGCFFLTLAFIGEIPFYVIAVTVVVGLFIDVEGNTREGLKIDGVLSRIMYTAVIIGVITHNLFAEISINQFIFILLIVHLTSRQLFSKSEYLRQTLVPYGND